MVIRVSVVYSSAPRTVHEVALLVDPGTTVAQALRASGFLGTFPELSASVPLVGVWGRRAAPQQVLRDQDRVEIYRPLTVDPKVARRMRFVKQGARSTGLFARKRPGAKAGY